MYSSEEFPHPEGEHGSFKIINLPSDNPDLRKALQAKLEEYNRRLEPVMNPENPEKVVLLGNLDVEDSLYKKWLLETLLQRGEVNTDEVRERITQPGGSVDK